MKRMITIFRTPALQACWGRGASKVRAGMLLLTMLFSSVTTWADTYKITFHLNGGTYEWDIDSYDDGDEFNLMKAAREDAIFKGWYTTKTFEDGTRIADVKGRTGDLEVWAKWECDPVTYIDENGEEQTTTEYVELNGSTEMTSLADSYDWYVVRGENVVYENQIGSSKDNLHIILMDGAKLTTQETFPLQCNGNMFIYGQSQGTGQLVATSNPAYGLYAIKSITINGGIINATGGNFGISAIEGNVTINGGTVTAHGKDYFGIEGPNVIINGGSVTATSDTYHGISVNGTGTIAINGGSVTASHGSDVDVSYYGNVKIGPGKAYTTGTDGTIYCGTLTEDELKAIDSQTLQPTTWDGGTTAETATVLTTPKHLELLAQCVNGGNDFSGKFFKLGGDIAYDAAMLTIDNDGDGTPESNHTPIGDASHAFAGTLDGQNHTISGLRITSASPRQGLFGTLGSTGVVKNVTLSDASIAGNDYTAGIVAHNSGKVVNCQVDNTVALHCVQNYYDSFGGIVGYNGPNGTVSSCVSSVEITRANGLTANSHFGGVVGNNNSTVTGCLAVGVIIPGVNNHGAVVGVNQMDGILTDNYYTVCTMAGTPMASAIGYGASGTSLDYTANNGAVPALRDDADNTTAIGLLAQVPDAFKPLEVALTGRTLYKDGKWNTLCLPFNVTLSGSVLDGAIARPLSKASISGSTLNLKFGEAVNELVAGTPYIIKWTGGDDLVSPVFHGVTIDATDRSYDNGATGGARVRFLGTSKSTTFDAENTSVLLMGAANTLYYPATGAGIGAQRAYFKIGDGTELARQLTSFNISFGDDETTGIENEELRMKNGESATATGWYTLDGRRLAGKPAQHGVYINNGKKIVIK